MDVAFMLYYAEVINKIPPSISEVPFEDQQYWPAWAIWAAGPDKVHEDWFCRFAFRP
jgi:hypothetical protein